MESLTENTIIIPDDVINAIVTELTAVMKKRIENVSPDDDHNADYGKNWTDGSYDDDDELELDAPFEEYGVSYHYELSWRYREWSEYWTDPDCTRDFSEMEDESGSVDDITIYTPDGDEVKNGICERIAKTVNENIN